VLQERKTRITPERSTAIMSSHAWSVMSASAARRRMPAAATEMSSRPNSSSAAWASFSVSSKLRTSMGTAVQRPPAASTARTVSVASWGSEGR
jgi:hypothetical protein